ncbi:hypothetical protein Tsubulata_050674 [Turnera subulata]|uniref:CWF21 domain-containing protein n=1 Tax=Turnera subulata TaxID=218843 RepID=A0A9Q0GIY7_9ROSI|nr:hypothetical protein Tsubulata_050674 [Turnera subulata]
MSPPRFVDHRGLLDSGKERRMHLGIVFSHATMDEEVGGVRSTTPRGSGSNGYIQTNKFFMKPKPGMVAPATRGYEGDQGTGGITKKPNKEILEHDRKRQIHLRLVELEDKLIEQGYTDAEIAEKLDEARKTLEAAAASEDAGGPTAVVVSEAW